MNAKGGLPASLLVALTALALTSLGTATVAQVPSPEEAEEYLGTWNLSASFQETPVELELEIVAEEEIVKAALGAAFQPEPQLIESITRDGEGLVLAYGASLGGINLRIEVKVAFEGGVLVGSFGDDLGLFSADFTGERVGDATGLVAQAILAAEQADQSSQGSPGPRQAKLTLEGGEELRISHAGLRVDTQDHRSLLSTSAGEVFSYGSSRTMKLLTDVDLVFGETRVPAHNLAPGYPGIYGLWLKRVDSGWHLVFNTQADLWGSQYEPTTDVAEVPLEIVELESAQQELRVELIEEEGGGLLRILWGNTAWSAPFQVE